MNEDPKPVPPEGLRAKFTVAVSISSSVRGDVICIYSRRADLAILTRVQLHQDLNGQTRRMMAIVDVNLKSTNLQIMVLERAGITKTFGGSHETDSKGFSVQRTILAHGSELDKKSPFYLS